GLLFDETITKVGKDFYDMFYNKWQFPETNESFFITFSERPMPGLGTRVTITIDDTQIFQQFVKPNYEQMELLSDYAVQILNNYIVDYEKIKKQLDQGDQTGSGIF
ncbi:MAG: CsgE family curli-type amyloid fiber assembly protein, partial [bacterium]